jgi:hypothetical protein
MYTLKNNELSVSILDPIADQNRLGSRYCTGGYIYQVSDAIQGELLSGPEYPKPFPNVFDGQGAPDMFFTPLFPGDVPVGGEVGCVGVGRVRRTSAKEPFDVRFNPEVIEFVSWKVDVQDQSVTMTTEQSFQDWSYRLTRWVGLNGREIHSKTMIQSTGKAVLPVRWFAHPFFPITTDNIFCHFSIPMRMPENAGFFYTDEGFICRKAEHDWARGFYQAFDFDPKGDGLTTIEKHPKVGQVTVTTDFHPGYLPIWGNDKTFSFEPYFIRELAQGEEAEWSIRYQF